LKALSLNLANDLMNESIVKSADKQAGKAKYLMIANAIRKAIKQGQVAPAEALPSARKLAEQLHTNRHTIMAAFAELIAEGWVEAKQRSGYRVVASLPIQSSRTTTAINKTQQRFNWKFVRQGIKQKTIRATQYQYNFAGGQPDLRLFPFEQLKSHFSQSCQRPAFENLSYGDSQGLPELIVQVDTYLRRVRSITDKDIMICNGSQEALYMISQLLLQAGDKVAVERLGYPPAWAAFKSAGANLVAINQDQHGLMPEHLEQQLKQGEIKLIYLTPLHQYPTTVTLAADRRMKIYQLASLYGAAIVEDDYDHEFHYKCQPIAPMAADDPAGLVIYISTFSKLMFGSARLGYVAANHCLIEQLAAYKALINHKSNILVQQTIARWMQEGGFETHLRRMTRIYQQRRDLTIKILQTYQQQGYPMTFTNPDGGMALWLDTKKDITGLKERLLTKNVYLQTQLEFELSEQNEIRTPEKPSYIRLGFAAMNEDELKQGLAIIMDEIY